MDRQSDHADWELVMFQNRSSPWTIFGLAACLSACSAGFGPGYTDFQANLPHEYLLTQASAHEVTITLDFGEDEKEIPAKVVSLGFDDHFILAQQQLLDAKDNPIRGKYQFWIIDAPAQKRLGPFTEDEFNAQRKVLGVSEEIKLRGTNSYRP